MSLNVAFANGTSGQVSGKSQTKQKVKRPAPFSLRLSAQEKAALEQEANGLPLGTYVKWKVLDKPPLRQRRTGQAIEDRKAMGQALALLGSSRLSSNLNQLAYAAKTGSLPLTPEVEAELRDAFTDIRFIRAFLLVAMGMQEELPE
jgi:hypothetical protein